MSFYCTICSFVRCWILISLTSFTGVWICTCHQICLFCQQCKIWYSQKEIVQCRKFRVMPIKPSSFNSGVLNDDLNSNVGKCNVWIFAYYSVSSNELSTDVGISQFYLLHVSSWEWYEPCLYWFIKSEKVFPSKFKLV